MQSRLFVFILVLFIFSFINGKKFCDYPNCDCCYEGYPCPTGMSDCRTEEYCKRGSKLQKPCCYNPPRTFCDSPGCGCYYYPEPCPPSTTDCTATKYCASESNKPCCKTSKAAYQS